MKKVCIVTGTRAEYGLLRPLIDKIKKDENIKLLLIVTGMHLSPEFGLTYKEIEADGNHIDEKIEILLSSDTPTGISKSMGLGLISFSETFDRLKPDMIIILGDRYEILSAACSALIAGVPIAHIHGGETGAGTIDNSIRHAITKMSNIHFTSTEAYRKRVIQLGENPESVYNVGSLGVENIKSIKLLPKSDLIKALKFDIDDKTILLTFHPLSLEPGLAKEQFDEILSAISRFKELRIIFTKCNSDTGGRVINEMIDEYVQKNHERAIAYYSLGTLRYLSAVKYVRVVMGNSSSGIIEVPSLGTNTLNIGKRQEGRIQSKSVYNCNPVSEDIYQKLDLLLKAPKPMDIDNPYDKENTSTDILMTIKEKLVKEITIEKNFYDIKY